MSMHGENTGESVQPDIGARTVCRQCSESHDADDNFCRYCGEMTEHGATLVASGKLRPQTSCESALRPPSWLESPVVVLPALFLVLGPLALPMLWRSRRFTRGWKIGLTWAVLLLTAALIWYAVETVKAAFNPVFQELRRSGVM